MNVSKVGVTQVKPIKNTLYGAYRDFVLGDCVEIRERVLKNGTRILAGYRKNSEYSNLIQKINKKGVIEQEKFYSSELFSKKNEKKETQLEKITYNKIGDKLKHFQLFRTYEKGKLTEKFEALMDIFKGVDKSERTDYVKETKIKKERINDSQYIQETFHQNVLIWRTTENDVDPEGMWRY
jgi:hypothetical protein